MAYNICKYGDGSGGGGGDERPDGSTITPVSDVSIWLRCGGLGSKGYTTLSQVLSDANTLDGLMSDVNAVNYLVRSTSWVSDITSNQSAMTYIGANDYAAYKLLSNSTWSNSICNSTYFESVLNVKVPTMTSDTMPSGKCSCSHGNAQTWQAFDGNDSTRMNLVSSSINYEWVEYWFETPLSVRKIKDLIYGTIDTRVSSAKLQYSLNGNTWNDIQTFSDYKNSLSHEYAISTSQTAKYWRIYVSFNVADYISYFTIQFYSRIFGNVQSWLKAGKIDKTYTTLEQVLSDSSTLQALMASTDAVDYLRACGNWASTICSNQSAMNYIGLNNYAANTLLADACWLNAIANSQYMESVLNVKVPVMTSDTTPSGTVVATAVSTQTTYKRSWHAYDSDNSTGWNGSGSQYPNIYNRYLFDSHIKLCMYKYLIGGGYSTSYTYTAKFQASNDKVNWFDISDVKTFAFSSSETKSGTEILSTPVECYGCGINILSCNNSMAYTFSVNELQFYGRKDV